MLLKIKREIDFNNTVYILKKGKDYQVFEEDPNGDETISLEEFFKNYKRWERGIYTDKWYSVFVSALSLEKPFLEIPEEVNLLLSFEPAESGYIISGIIFDKNGEKAFEKALLFSKVNRLHISFEVSPKLSVQVIKVDKEKLFLLLENLLRELREIKKLTLKTYRETKEIKQQTEENLSLTKETYLVLKEIKNLLEEKFSLLTQRVSAIERKLEGRSQSNSSEITAVVLNSPGIYTESGKPVNIPLLGKVADYVEVDFDAFVSFFGLKTYLTSEELQSLREVINKKVLKKVEEGETHFTSEELNRILEKMNLPTLPYNKRWILTVKVKKEEFQKLVKAIKEVLGGVPLKDIETALKCLFKEHPIKGNPPVSFDLLKRCFPSRYHPKLEKLRKLISTLEKGEEPSNVNFVVGPANLLLLALELEARRRGKKLLIRQI